MHDNYPVHTANIVRRWIEDQPQLEVLPWPSYSPDLNPIENVWANIVNVWEPEEERTRQQLLNHMMREWEVLRRKPQIIHNHVTSLSDRLRDVIANNGLWTKY
ncbi:hypothetical protein Pcinc_016373 [Petrolisthes cinctipes]|uniref:Tc1-like transposase DDE domain-containing protein n=1 Tax=Petrolisthes cinctipes TaxID=88211 RepID=A0AAE1FR68_PETCI|nr:hypothetical protein Pcinc_016373 [Petrolisthes cinctipes]